jgi:hypothetical protein
MSLTLNQVKSLLESLSLSHKQVNSFRFGHPAEFDANGEIVYGAIFLEYVSMNIDRVNKEQRFDFRMYIGDLVPESTKSEENETEVLSDTASIAADMVALINKAEYADDWWLADNTPGVPFEESLGDMIAGHTISISIGVEFISDACQVPADNVEPNNDFDMARTRILTYTADGSEGDSFTVPNLAGKIVLASYNAGDYRRIITTVPTAFDYIGVVGTDLGDRKGIASSTGVVKLVSGDGLVNGQVLDFIIWE